MEPLKPSAEALRILLVEDNASDARLIRELLDDGQADVAIDHVQTLAEAVSRTGQNGYDVALLDLELPDSSGIDTVRALTAASAALPLVVLTQGGDDIFARNAIDGGVMDYVVKGKHDGEALEMSIQNAIARHRRICEVESDSSGLRNGVSELEAVFDVSPLPMIIIDFEASVYMANREAAALVGRGEGELDHLPVGDAIRCLQSLDNPKGCGFGAQCGRCELRLAAAEAVEQGVTNRVECVREMRDADFVTSTRVLEVSTAPIDINGHRMALICLNDLTDAKAADEKIRFLTRMLNISSDINDLMAHEKDSQRLLDETCRVVAENVHNGSAWVGLANLESGGISIAASCGVELDLLEGLGIRCDDTPLGRGPMGTAIRENRTVSVRDTLTSPMLARWREVFKNRGLRSTIAVPLRVAYKTVGALEVSSPLSDTFSPEIRRVLEEAVNDLGNALTAIEATHSAESSEERFRVLYHEAPVGYHELDETGTIVQVNTTEAEMLGYEVDEMLGQPVWTFIRDRLAEKSRRAVLARIIEGTQLEALEWRFQRKDGSEIEVLIEDRQVSDESGRVVGLRATMQDISERKKMERTLQFTKFVVDRAGEAAFWLNEYGRFTYFNDAACQLLGYQRSEINNLSVSDVNPDYQIERWRELWRELKEKRSLRLESYVTTKDGRETPVEVAIDFVEFDGDEFGCAYVRDISERVHAQQVESTLQNVLHAATTADDLRTLISEICGLMSGLIDTTNFYVALYDPKTETYRYPFYLDKYDDVDPNELFRESNTLTDLVRRTGEPLLVDEEFSHILEQRGEVELVGTPSPIWMGVPLVTEHGTIGVVAVQSYDDPELYDEQDLELLGYAAGTIAIAVERRRAEDELRRHVVQQHLISETSTAFMSVGEGDVDEAVERCLCDLGTFTDVDRSYVFLFSDNGDRLDNTHEWCAEGIESQRDRGQGLTTDDFPWAISILAAGEVLDVPRVSDLPDEAGSTKAEFEAQNIRSLLCVPMVRGDRVVGFLGLDSVGRERRWTADTITLLRTVGETLANALERHRADQALLASEKRYRLLVERNPAGVYRISAIDGSVLDCNLACAKLFGYEDPKVLLGRNIEDFYFNLSDRGPFRSTLETNAEVSDYDLSFKHRNGTEVRCLVNALLSNDEDGKPAVIEGTVVDISSRLRTEEALRSEKAHLEKLFDSAPEAIVLTDNEGVVTRVNPMFTEIFGYSPDEARNRHIDELIAPPDRREEAQSITQHVTDGKPVQVETVRAHRDGAPVDVSVIGAPIETQGEQVGVYAIYRDISENKQLEENFRQAQKMQAIGRLAGGVAHDFNNLLQAFSGLTHALRRHSEDPAAYLDRITDLNDLIKRGAQLTRQLLLFSRRETTEPERLDLNEVVHGTEKLLRHLLRENIRVAVVPTQGEAPVEADRGQLEQVIINLVVNAQEAMPAGGRLVIRTALRSSGHTVLEIEDSGHGIPEDIREKVFDPFFTTKAGEGGTGLGLSVVHGIVERFGGTIQVNSEVDQGSTFRITLPPVPDGVVDTQEPTTREDIASLRGSNQLILLVEDENEVRKGLTEMLTILGYRVEAVDRIESAREAISDGEFDLLITDMVLPDGSGADLIKELRAIHPEVPVIAMSGYTTETPGLEAIAAGELRFIQKPFGLDEVAREVRSALGTAVV